MTRDTVRARQSEDRKEAIAAGLRGLAGLVEGPIMRVPTGPGNQSLHRAISGEGAFHEGFIAFQCLDFGPHSGLHIGHLEQLRIRW